MKREGEGAYLERLDDLARATDDRAHLRRRDRHLLHTRVAQMKRSHGRVRQLSTLDRLTQYLLRLPVTQSYNRTHLLHPVQRLRQAMQDDQLFYMYMYRINYAKGIHFGKMNPLNSLKEKRMMRVIGHFFRQ